MPTPKNPPADEAQAAPNGTPATVEQTAQSALNLAMALDDDFAKLRGTLTDVKSTADAAYGQLTGLDARLEGGAENIMDQVTKMMGDVVQGANDQMAALQGEVRTLRVNVDHLRESVPSELVDGEPVPRVHGKVLELMRAVSSIGKDRKADAKMGGYAFRGIDQVMDAVGRAMRDVGLVLESRVIHRDWATDESRSAEGRTIMWTSARLVMRYQFVDPSDGSKHTFEMIGEARAMDDKATSKAESMALKYGLLQALMIPVEGMADGDGESPQVERSPQDPRQNTAQRPPEKSKPERARDALAAMKNINQVEPAKREAHLDAIGKRIAELDMWRVEVDGATLQAHWVATKATVLPAVPSPGEPF